MDHMRKRVLFEPEEDLVLFAGHAVTDHGQKPFREPKWHASEDMIGLIRSVQRRYPTDQRQRNVSQLSYERT